MVKTYLDALFIRNSRNIAELSPAMVDFIGSDGARRNALLHEWRQHAAHQRACDDADGAVSGFIAICVLVVIALGVLVTL